MGSSDINEGEVVVFRNRFLLSDHQKQKTEHSPLTSVVRPDSFGLYFMKRYQPTQKTTGSALVMFLKKPLTRSNQNGDSYEGKIISESL